jgi:hypothetical protein
MYLPAAGKIIFFCLIFWMKKYFLPYTIKKQGKKFGQVKDSS